MDDRYQSVMNSTGIHQMILQGPPGTSKTYGVKEFLALQAGLITTNGESWDENALNARQLCTEDNEYILPTVTMSTGISFSFIHPIHMRISYVESQYLHQIQILQRLQEMYLKEVLRNIHSE